MSDPYGDNAPAIVFEQATRTNNKVLMAVIGTSGTGKTPIALALARGVIGPAGKLFVIGTEGDRALFYADRFEFKHARMLPPYTPDRIAEHIEAAGKQGADAIVLDSGSDAYEGIGGARDMADNSNLQAPLNWAFPKDRYRKMIQRIVNVPVHVFITFRADEKIEIIDDPDKPMKNGKPQKKVIPKGWTPIWEKRTPYWMQVSLMLVPGPNLGDLAERRFYRCDDDLRPIFLRPGRIDEKIGAELGAWLASGKTIDRGLAVLRADALSACDRGIAGLKAFWDERSREEKAALQADMPGLKAAAAAVTEEQRRIAAETEAPKQSADGEYWPPAGFWDRSFYDVPVHQGDLDEWACAIESYTVQAPNGDCVDKLRQDNYETLTELNRDRPNRYLELLKHFDTHSVRV